MMRERTSHIGRLGLIVAGILAFPGAADAAYVGTVIASGLNAPRGLSFGPDGALYIAEAGILTEGGATTFIRGEEYRYGRTSSITRYQDGVQERILRGLPSLVAVTTGEATGANDVAFGADGTGYIAIGLGTDPAVRTGDLAAGPQSNRLGTILSFSGTTVSLFSDVAAYEAANNPAGGPVDSNPFHLAPLAGGGLLVSDAGANTLYEVSQGGSLTLLATIPGRDIGGGFPSDPVPTGVAVGPDGAYYLAELTGFPFTPGAANIYRMAAGEAPTVFQSGFTNITDIAFGADGNLYVLELDSNGMLNPGGEGALIRVGMDGSRETIFSTGLVMPTGLAIGSDGAFYVSNFSAATGGQVLRIAAAAIPEPASWAMMIIGFGLVGHSLRRRTQPQREAVSA